MALRVKKISATAATHTDLLFLGLACFAVALQRAMGIIIMILIIIMSYFMIFIYFSSIEMVNIGMKARIKIL